MGVEVVAVAEPVDDATRRTLRKIEKVEPIQGKVEGSGPVFAFSHNSNAALRAVNEILAAGGTVSFAKVGRHHLRGEGRIEALLQKNGVNATSVKEAPEALAGQEAAHRHLRAVGRQYRRGLDAVDLRAVPFPVHARCAMRTFRRATCASSYDSIVIAEMGTRQIMDGMRPGTVPGQYAGGIGDDGRAGSARFRDAGRNAGDAGQCQSCSRSISSACR